MSTVRCTRCGAHNSELGTRHGSCGGLYTYLCRYCGVLFNALRWWRPYP